MINLEISERALEDISGIWFYTLENWGLVQADKYVDELYEQFDLLKIQPAIGTPSNWLGRNLRRLPTGRHVIIYRLDEATLNIIRILGADMDIPNQF